MPMQAPTSSSPNASGRETEAEDRIAAGDIDAFRPRATNMTSSLGAALDASPELDDDENDEDEDLDDDDLADDDVIDDEDDQDA